MMRYGVFLLPLLVACTSMAPSPIAQQTIATLATSQWQLQRLNGQNVIGNTAITLHFAEATLYGNSGCNQYNATYSVQPPSSMVIRQSISTQMACLDERIMTQETQYHQALQHVKQYHLKESLLVLSDANMHTLLEYHLLANNPLH
jgi:heat shock protein HslJ